MTSGILHAHNCENYQGEIVKNVGARATNVTITASDAAFLKKKGKGNLSRGLRLLVAFVKGLKKKEVANGQHNSN